MTLPNPPIKFGTDGWRGIIADDFTVDRLTYVAPRAALVLADVYGSIATNRTIIVGYDRRFMSEEFAKVTAESVAAIGFDVWLSETYAPTPAFSWAAKQMGALGALVITASHNPANYSGLKVKSTFGGSVPPEVTHKIEDLFGQEIPTFSPAGQVRSFNPWPSYCEGLRSLVDIAAIQSAIQSGSLTVYADVMHGAAATGIAQLLGVEIQELHGDRDPLFGGGAPEPLPKYLGEICDRIKIDASELKVGLVFDGDSDRIAGIDAEGNFLSSQGLIPILIQHLVTRRGLTGEVVRTVSGLNLISKTAELYGCPVFETPIGYKYIGDRMLESAVLLGGEESGGIGYGHHIPERDALLSALYLLEAIVQSGQDLGALYRGLQEATQYASNYDRIDMHLSGMDVRDRLLSKLQTEPMSHIAERSVLSTLTVDGYKFQLSDGSWLLIRFSGTEPVLRLYCEAQNPEDVQTILQWARQWAEHS